MNQSKIEQSNTENESENLDAESSQNTSFQDSPEEQAS